MRKIQRRKLRRRPVLWLASGEEEKLREVTPPAGTASAMDFGV
jgi:hypothetical protein